MTISLQLTQSELEPVREELKEIDVQISLRKAAKARKRGKRDKGGGQNR